MVWVVLCVLVVVVVRVLVMSVVVWVLVSFPCVPHYWLSPRFPLASA